MAMTKAERAERQRQQDAYFEPLFAGVHSWIEAYIEGGEDFTVTADLLAMKIRHEVPVMALRRYCKRHGIKPEHC